MQNCKRPSESGCHPPSAPAVAKLERNAPEHRKHPLVEMVAQLSADPPASAIAIVVFDRAGKVGRSWNTVVAKDREPNVYDVLAGEMTLDAAAIPTAIHGLSVVPSSPELAGANVERIAGRAEQTRFLANFDRAKPIRYSVHFRNIEGN